MAKSTDGGRQQMGKKTKQNRYFCPHMRFSVLPLLLPVPLLEHTQVGRDTRSCVHIVGTGFTFLQDESHREDYGNDLG